MSIGFIQNMPLDCYDDGLGDNGQKSISFGQCGKVSIIQGSNTLDKVDLTSIAIPISEYVHTVREIPPNGNMVNGISDLLFIIVIVKYPRDESITFLDKSIEWSFDSTNWYDIREMLVVTGSNDVIYLRNNKSFTVTVDIMCAK